MKIREIICESKNLLFHKTTVQGLNKIVQSGKIDVSSPEITDPDWDSNDYGNVSMTRNRNWYHFNDEANAVTISISGQALKHHYNLDSFVWQSNLDPNKHADDEEESRVNRPIPFNKLYIKAIHIGYNIEDLKPGILDHIRKLGIPVHVNPNA